MRTGLRRFRRSSSAGFATHTAGNTRPSVRLSKARRSGPGRKVTVSTGTWTLLKITDRFWRSLGLFAADLEELGRMRHGIEHDQRALRHLQGKDGPLACRQVDDFERDVVQQLLQIGRKIDRRTPEDLAIIFGRGQFVGIMGRDLPHARAYREGHLDQIVERRLIARGAESAIILRAIQRLQAFVGGKNAGAARAHHVPCHLEHAEPHRIQQRRDDPLFVDAFLAREIKRVHLVQGMIRGIPHHALEHVDNVFVGRLTQGRKQGLGFAHATMLPERRQREHPLKEDPPEIS